MSTHPILVGQAGVVVRHREAGMAKIPHDIEWARTQFEVLRGERTAKGMTTQPAHASSFAQPGDDELDGVRQKLLTRWPIEPADLHCQK